MKRILLTSDHAGFKLKNQLVKYLKQRYQVQDLGTYQNKSCHYPDFSQLIAKTIKPQQKGIAVCGSGIGISIGVIKCNVRCSVAFNQYTAKQCRNNNCQIIGLGARVITPQLAYAMIDEFLIGY